MSETNGSLALEQKVIVIEASERPQPCKLRVAAYARVSSASDDQENSFGAQMRYFTTLISANENWTLADIYADEGITGTSVEKRDDFKRLLADCRRGLVDKVLTKSVSRFARNAKECLEAVRELKALGVGIVFEKENIDTSSMSSEMILAFFASFAQAESESISGNMRWSYKRRMESGEFNTCKYPFGYRLQNGTLEVYEPEAEIVRLIFERFLAGDNCDEIAERVSSLGIPTRDGQTRWPRSTISYILQNERYAGNALLQKEYRTDALPFKKKRNHGEKVQYYVTGCHSPIVSREIFDAATALRDQKSERTVTARHSSVPLALRLQCGECGSMFKRKQIGDTVYWVCRNHNVDKDRCPVAQVPEAEIYAAFLRLFYKLKHHGEPMLQNMLDALQELRDRQMLWSPDVVELNKQICDLMEQNRMLTELKTAGLIDSDFYIRRSNELAAALREAKLKKERLLNAVGGDSIARTQELLEALDTTPEFLEEFDDGWFDELVDKIIMESNCLRFRLKNGLELREKLERRAR